MAGNGKNKSKNNVTKIRRFKLPNIGIIMLSLIFVYLIVSLIIYATKKKVLIYEVCAGQLVSDNTFTGVIIYDESVVRSGKSGYINFFLNDSERAGTGTIICTVDETGSISSKLTAVSEKNNLSPGTLNSIAHSLTGFSREYNQLEFYQTYRVFDDISSIITEYNASYMVESLKKLLEDGNNFVNIIKPDKSTMVSFYMDSLFGLKENEVTAQTFNQEIYTTQNLKARELIGAGDVLYRTIDSDAWKVVFPITENQIDQYFNTKDDNESDNRNYNSYNKEKTVTVRFISQDIKVTATLSIIRNADGNNYGLLKFSKYIVNFFNSRFVEFELMQEAVTGLKIPVSTVCEKEFYTIPVEFGCTSDDDSRNTGFLLLGYDQSGNQTRKFVDAVYYANDKGYYYVSEDVFESGDCVVMPPKEGEISFDDKIYIVGTVDSLKGVYCVNKGYCQFRQVDIINSNEEYHIIRRGTPYGLSIYDHIILNADYVTENQIIY